MELQDLKDLASKLEVEHHHLLGAEKLTQLLKEHCEQKLGKSFAEVAQEYGYEVTEEDTEYVPTVDTGVPTNTDKLKLTFEEVDEKTRKESDDNAYKDAMKLTRCMITCNNRNKSSYTGEIFSARNAAVNEVKKFVPFGVPTHVPEILLNMIREKEYQLFQKERLSNGNVVTRSRLTPEYNIQILPPITPDEFEAIKRKQLAEGEGVKNG